MSDSMTKRDRHWSAGSCHLTRIQKNGLQRADAKRYGTDQAQQTRAFHQTMEEYTVTPLVELEQLAEHCGLRSLYVKDESHRFGLNAFKGLGGSYAIHVLPPEKAAR